MKLISDVLYKLSNWMTIAIVSLMTAIVVLEVFCRNVLGFSFDWSEELTRYLLVWLTFVGGSIAFRNKQLVGFTFVSDKLSPALKRRVALAAQVVLAVFLMIVMYYGIMQVTSPSVLQQLSPGMRLPMFWPYLAIPLGTGFMLIHILAHWNDRGSLSSRGD